MQQIKNSQQDEQDRGVKKVDAAPKPSSSMADGRLIDGEAYTHTEFKSIINKFRQIESNDNPSRFQTLFLSWDGSKSSPLQLKLTPDSVRLFLELCLSYQLCGFALIHIKTWYTSEKEVEGKDTIVHINYPQEVRELLFEFAPKIRELGHTAQAGFFLEQALLEGDMSFYTHLHSKQKKVEETPDQGRKKARTGAHPDDAISGNQSRFSYASSPSLAIPVVPKMEGGTPVKSSLSLGPE